MSNVRPHEDITTSTARLQRDACSSWLTRSGTVLAFSGDWYEKLPSEERERVDSMVGETFEVEEIDEYGQPWVCKR